MRARRIRLMPALVGAFLLSVSCATAPPRQSPEEWTTLKTPLAKGERILRANSCSRYLTPSFLGGASATFGSCYLTNLRFIFEESEWAKALQSASKLVPTNSDFGIVTLSRALQSFQADYIVKLGKGGKLKVTVKTGRILIPLSDIDSMELTKDRWLTLYTQGELQQFTFEIYDLPPDKTGLLPRKVSAEWMDAIQKTYDRVFGGGKKQ